MSNKNRNKKSFTYYKLVKVLDNHRYSIDCPTVLQLEYKENEWTVPEYGKLCCFDNKDLAINFANWYINRCYKVEIWECKIGKRYSNPTIPRPKNYGNIIDLFEVIEHLRKTHQKFAHLCYPPGSFPTGSVFTDKIMLVKKVFTSSPSEVLEYGS